MAKLFVELEHQQVTEEGKEGNEKFANGYLFGAVTPLPRVGTNLLQSTTHHDLGEGERGGRVNRVKGEVE